MLPRTGISIALPLILSISAKSIAQTAVPPQVQASAAELAGLRAQLDASKQFFDAFISMAQWAFGTAIAVGLALAAFSWFTNKANYERDKEFLRQQVDALRSDSEALISERLGALKEELLGALQQRQAAIRSAVSTDIAEKIKVVDSKAESAYGMALDLLAEAQQKTAEQSVKDDMLDWAVCEYCELIEIYVRRGNDHMQTGEVFDKINEIIAKPGFKFRTARLADAIKRLESLPKHHAAITETLIPKLKTLLG